jgi:hypothetical protein
MFCPECGFDADDAKFCPECGTDLDGIRGAVGRERGRSGGDAAKPRSTGAKKARRSPDPGVKRSAASGPKPQTSGVNPLYLWIVIAVIAVAVVIAIVLTQGSSGSETAGGGSNTTTAGSAPALSEVDISGSYDELVAAGNGYFDTGAPFIESDQLAEAVPWFAAAAKAYGAAWKKQPGDPAMGTDLATSIFYSATSAADIEKAVTQIDKVIAENPDFQNARFNKGNYVAMLARMAEQKGDAAAAKKLFAEAKAEYEAAVAIDATSGSGQAAAAALKNL